MDVETAVQLERLEEVERAVLMLDPDIIRPSEDDDHDDATVAMTRPADDDASATSVRNTTPVVPMEDRPNRRRPRLR